MSFTIIPSRRSYFLISQRVPSPVLVTRILSGVRIGMIPGDLNLQLGEAREYARNLTKRKDNFHIEESSTMTTFYKRTGWGHICVGGQRRPARRGNP